VFARRQVAASLLAWPRSSEADYVLRGYGATLYSGVFGTRPDHGAGVAIALAASAILVIAAASIAVLIHRREVSLDSHSADT
jgi:hypothetical protein